jgi:hypothetical protein
MLERRSNAVSSTGWSGIHRESGETWTCTVSDLDT